jgi:riboflavin kinase / FMN adenylyltransferase
MTVVARGPGSARPTAPSVVTIGNFDGVHRGHQVLLRRAVDALAEHDVRSVAVTFDPHPARCCGPTRTAALQTLDDRIAAWSAPASTRWSSCPSPASSPRSTPAGFVAEVLAGRWPRCASSSGPTSGSAQGRG